MSGLEVVDDQTFKVTLAAPFSIFPVKLGYSAFVPLPDAFFSSTPEAFGKKPIGNGPVKFVSWQDNVEIKLTRFDDYKLDDKVKVKDVTVKLYQDQDAAYAGPAVRQPGLPAGRFRRRRSPARSGRPTWASAGIEAPMPTTGIIAFPIYDSRVPEPEPASRPSRWRSTGSEINDKIFFGTRTAGRRRVEPARPRAPGTNDCSDLQVRPDRGQGAAAEGRRLRQGEMVFYYNADGAATRSGWRRPRSSVKNTLGINARAEGLPTFAVFRQQVNAHKMTGLYRAAWQAGLPGRRELDRPAVRHRRLVQRRPVQQPAGRRPLQGGHRGRRRRRPRTPSSPRRRS